MATEQQPQSISIPPRTQNNDFNRYIVDTSDILELLEHDWLGEKYDPQQGQWIKEPNATPLAQPEGIHFIIKEMRARCNKNIYISDFSEDVISQRVDTFLRILNDTLLLKGADLGIPSEVIPSLVAAAGDMVEAAYRRAKDHGERDYYGKSVYEVSTRRLGEGGQGGIASIPLIGRLVKRGDV